VKVVGQRELHWGGGGGGVTLPDGKTRKIGARKRWGKQVYVIQALGWVRGGVPTYPRAKPIGKKFLCQAPTEREKQGKKTVGVQGKPGKGLKLRGFPGTRKCVFWGIGSQENKK